ncbi:MAG: LuxR C-terminal-related transcriptional regulator [Chloroflexaceae bacterium]
MSNQFLTTKFHIPPWRATAISRPRLLERLTAGLRDNRKLTLVSAPAGYGKTTLITGWLHALAQADADRRVTWLALGDADNDPARFLYYWLAAFQQVDASLNEKLQPLVSLPHLPPTTVLLDTLLNELAAHTSPLLLTLDDYHVITQPDIHAALDYFIGHQPAHVHLVLTTRADPPLPLARLRARGQMTEIRARDLRFTPEEAHQFFAGALSLPLAAEALQALDERTEGWAAGLHLAGLALQNQPDLQRFITTFRGSHRYVLDYLAEEVLRRQGEEVRAFLTQTSILDRFNADACSALTGRADAQAVIAHLERVNLFVVPLDDERIWYRYHHLFADYLRTLLTRPEQAALNRRAATWHAANGLPVEAVQYALAAADAGFAADVIERALQEDTTWSGGNVALLSSWLDALPPQALRDRPRLSLNAARILYLAGRFDQAEACIAQTEQTPAAQPEPTETEQMRALAALYRGSIAAVRGDAQQALAQTHFAQARLPRADHLAHARALFSLGPAYELSGQTALAVQNYIQSSEEATAAGVLFPAIHARCAAAQAQIIQGRLHLAEQSCHAAIELAGVARLAPLGLAWSIRGGIALERNDLATAGQHLQEGIAPARQGGLMDDVVVGLAFLARLHAYQGDPTGALATIGEAQSIIRGYGVERMNMLAAAHRARLLLYLGQQAAAAEWATAYQAVRGDAPRAFEELTLARILSATGTLDPLPAILQPLLEQAEAAGHGQTWIEALLLLGVFHQARQDTPAALDRLEQALRRAAPEDYARIFLDVGQPLFALLPQARHAAPQFVDTLLSMGRPAGATPATPQAHLPEPLSDQELRVLRLIVAGKSNREIAAELVITVGTAKWHVHNVLQKLGVNSRPKAIARARELGIA